MHNIYIYIYTNNTIYILYLRIGSWKCPLQEALVALGVVGVVGVVGVDRVFIDLVRGGDGEVLLRALYFMSHYHDFNLYEMECFFLFWNSYFPGLVRRYHLFLLHFS